MCAKMSPGERTTAQRIATTDRKVPRFLFDVTGSLSFPAEPFRLSGQTAACLRPAFVRLVECKLLRLAL